MLRGILYHWNLRLPCLLRLFGLLQLPEWPRLSGQCSSQSAYRSGQITTVRWWQSAVGAILVIRCPIPLLQGLEHEVCLYPTATNPHRRGRRTASVQPPSKDSHTLLRSCCCSSADAFVLQFPVPDTDEEVWVKFLVRDELGEYSRNILLNPNGKPASGSARQHVDAGRFLRFAAGSHTSTGSDSNSPGLWVSSVSGTQNRRSCPHSTHAVVCVR